MCSQPLVEVYCISVREKGIKYAGEMQQQELY
jgi:hypothetical protein